MPLILCWIQNDKYHFIRPTMVSMNISLWLHFYFSGGPFKVALRAPGLFYSLLVSYIEPGRHFYILPDFILFIFYLFFKRSFFFPSWFIFRTGSAFFYPIGFYFIKKQIQKSLTQLEAPSKVYLRYPQIKSHLDHARMFYLLFL